MRRRLCLAGALLPLLPRQALACGTLGAGQVVRGRFVQTRHLQGFPRPLVSHGRFVLSPDHGLIWEVETPFAVVTIMSPAGLVQQRQGAETFRLAADRLPFMSRLYAMLEGALGGNWAALASDFTIARTGSATDWQVTLTPKGPQSPSMPFRSIEARGGCLVDSVNLVKPAGDIDALAFSDQAVTTGPLSAAEAATLAVLRP